MTVMRQKQTIKRLGFLLAGSLAFLMLIGCAATSAEEGVPTGDVNSPPVAGKTIVWGKADLEPTDAINKWQPVADYLAANLGDAGVTDGAVRIAPDSETIGRLLESGHVDLVIDSFYPAMIASDHSGASPLVVRTTGKPSKHAVFFARTDSGLKSLADLEGKMMAFEDPASTSGFMLPMGYLKTDGLDPREKQDLESSVNADEIGYVFAGDDQVVAVWVLSGKVAAGAVDNETFEDFSRENPGVLTILAETESILSDNMVLVRKDMDPALREAVKAVLLGMDQTAGGQAVLEGTRTASFEDVNEEVSVAWTHTRELYQLIKD